MSAARFQIGDRVTVRRGTRDPDFADIPLGGWTGTIREVGLGSPESHYLVGWNEYTLANMHPVYRQRCMRDDLDAESMWLRESDLEPATGPQPALDQPETLKPRPLQFNNPADRIRAALDLTSDDPLPEVDLQTMRRYHAYLNDRLTFPLQAEFLEDEAGFAAPPLPVQVIRLWPVEELDPALGLQAEVREGKQVFLVPLSSLVVRGDARAMVLIQDYAAWYVDWVEQQQADPEADDSARTARESFAGLSARWAVYGAGCGASVGAVLTTLPGAPMGFLVGAFLVGTLGYLAGAKFGGVIDLTSGTIRRSIMGTFIATFIGVMAGGVLGVLVVAIIGTLLGSMAFHVLGNILDHLRLRLLSSGAWTALGAFLGALAHALLLNTDSALSGALTGAAVGGGGVLLVMLATVLMFALFGPDEPPSE